MSLTRRSLIVGGAAVLAAGRVRPAEMITLSPRPVDLEMPLGGFTSEITPTSEFFVRCHTYTPQVRLSDWSLKIDGLVSRPLELSLSDLKQFPHTRFAAVLECAGNGRAFYQPRLPGAQWRFGSVGNAVWTGVRVADVLQKVGLKPGASQLLLDGADTPLGAMPDFQRTLPVRKALDPDTLLAWEMNGDPLTANHGFPLRVIAPGWAGDSWVKWLQHIEVLDHDFDGFWMKTAYRHPSHSVPAGSVVDAKDMIPVEDLNVKSVIATPEDWAAPGLVSIQGVAWSNTHPVTKVEVSTDSGKTWGTANLKGHPARYGFRAWSFSWRATEGKYGLISRATNSAGQTQPLEQEWNPSGYLWNVAQVRLVDVAKGVTFSGLSGGQSVAEHPPGYDAACLGCHDEHMMQQQHLTPAQWDREVTKMTGWGAPVQPERRGAILEYLTTRFHP